MKVKFNIYVVEGLKKRGSSKQRMKASVDKKNKFLLLNKSKSLKTRSDQTKYNVEKPKDIFVVGLEKINFLGDLKK